MLAVLCMASFSITAFASGGDETTTVPDAETATDPKEDIEIPYSYIIDEDGNLVITIGGVTDPTEIGIRSRFLKRMAMFTATIWS